jgi:fructose-1,6-bisphosphatase I
MEDTMIDLELHSNLSHPTLATFLRQTMVSVPARLGGLAQLLEEIATACSQIAEQVSRATHLGMDAPLDETNQSGDVVKQLDRIADDIFAHRLEESGFCAALVSEERAEPLVLPDRDAAYLVAADPLDGSSNIGCAIPVGTIFSVLPRVERTVPPSAADFLRRGRDLVAAGYVIYGPTTELVLTTGDGVHVFGLDPDRQWRLVRSDLRLPLRGTIYSINEANSPFWTPELVGWVESLKQQGYTQRYVGSMVADVHRTLLKGGIFLYPGSAKHPEGKLRYLYEGAPMALLFEAAGGRATTGAQRLLDVVPNEIHEKTPVILGGRAEVLELERALGRQGTRRVRAVGVPASRRGTHRVKCAFELEGRKVTGSLEVSPQSGKHQFVSH